MKKTVFKVIIVGMVVFLALPVIFDKGDGFATTKGANPGELEGGVGEDFEQMLILEGRGKTLPIKDGNFATKFVHKIGNFYGGAFKAKKEYADDFILADAEILLPNQQPANQDRAAIESGLLDEEVSVAQANSIHFMPATADNNAATIGLEKQIVHRDVAVKGLYEASSTDTYEQRVEAQKAYNAVMGRINSTMPVVDNILAAKAKSAKGLATPADYASENTIPVQTAQYNNDSDPVGIASRGSTSSSYSGGVGSSFSGSGLSAGADSAETSFASFEDMAKMINEDIKTSASTTAVGGGRGSIYNGGSSNQGGSMPNNPAKPENPNNPAKPENPNNPAKPENPNNPAKPENPGGPDPEKPIRPLEQRFDFSAWLALPPQSEVCTLDNAPMPDSVPGEGMKFKISGGDKPQVAHKHNEQDDIVNVNACKVDLPKLDDKVKTYKFIVDLGLQGQTLVSPTEKVNAGLILKELGANVQTTNSKPLNKDGLFVTTAIRDFREAARDPNTIILTVQNVQGYSESGRVVTMKAGEIEKVGGLARIVSAINNVPAAVSQAKKKAKEDEKLKEKDLASVKKMLPGKK